MTSPADEVRDLMSRYETSPARTRAALDALGRSEQADAERGAADVLAGYGFTADDIREGIAEGGTVKVTFITGDPEATS